jgi:hypothetical protein
MRAAYALTLAAAVTCAGALAQEREGADKLNAALNEQLVMLPYPGSLLGLELEVTLFKPDGPGPFPLLVINHGKDGDDVKLITKKPRYPYGVVAHEFVKRGWLVAVPMRRGFGRSGGIFEVEACEKCGAPCRLYAYDELVG